MNMLEVITLHTLDMIFEGSEYKLSPKAKIMYINCLMHHFRLKEATVINATAFEMFEEDFGDFSKYKTTMQELHKSGIIEMGYGKVIFHNKWGQYIDRTKLDNPTGEQKTSGFSFNGIEVYETELKASESLIELAMMRNKISRVDVINLMDLFMKEQIAFEKKYSNFSDCAKHFAYWAQPKAKQMSKEPSKQVKSNGKILGQ
jgi:hypothetical protein